MFRDLGFNDGLEPAYPSGSNSGYRQDVTSVGGNGAGAVNLGYHDGPGYPPHGYQRVHNVGSYMPPPTGYGS